ncbi:hypothetical protein R50073_28780 [Maricurvus nonylphenolicus]|uniref:hypothetical protein n=1 Tax=Maricurvus nonylphenolicus TaxID=1008307 RepID=UPI0036F2C980
MNLPSSIVVSAFIVAVVWFGVVYQPGNAWAYPGGQAQAQEEAQASAQEDSKVKDLAKSPAPQAGIPAVTENDLNKRIDAFKMEGITRNVTLAGAQELWVDFGDRYDLHNRLNGMHVSTYTLYDNFNDDYSRADVTIGYNVEALRGEGSVAASVPAGNYATLLEEGKRSQSEIAGAWEKLNYDRGVKAILEEHTVNTSGQVIASAIYVLYGS